MVGTLIVVPILVLAAFVAWRYTSVARGARKRDEALFVRLDPLAKRFEQGESVSAAEIERVASAPELRLMLHALLDYHKRLDLFPARFLSPEAQAESHLVYWMLHPNELGEAPAAIALETTTERNFLGKRGTFYVFRFQMPDRQAAASEWELGLAGPLSPDDQPYQNQAAGGFWRSGDVVGKTAPSELVDWYVAMWQRKRRS